MDHMEFEEQTEIARFLEKFNQEGTTADFAFPVTGQPAAAEVPATPQNSTQEPYQQSFEKLEEKMKELEEKFAVSAAQNQAVMQELARTRQAVENQQTKDAFLASITSSIANLKQSVEKLSAVHTTPTVNTPAFTNATAASAAGAFAGEYSAMAQYQPATYRAAQQAKLQAVTAEKEQALLALQQERSERENLQLSLQAQQAEKERVYNALEVERACKAQLQASLETERTSKAAALKLAQEETEEKTRFISSLQQKTSQLRAVNSALDREIKRVQEEKMEALRKSAKQAKEILSLRDALSAAEERFKSFDFNGRVISVKRFYEQKVSKLETQLQEISNTCMKQVEEIEFLKAENLKLQHLAQEKDQLAALYEAKTQELESVKQTLEQLRSQTETANQNRLSAFTQRVQHLQAEQEALSQRLTTTQQTLQLVSQEKQTLEQNFKTLLLKIKDNDTVIASLKQKISVLTHENQELKKEKTVASAAHPQVVRTAQPVARPIAKPAAKQAAQMPSLPSREPIAAATFPKKTPTLTASAQAHKSFSRLQTEADLPEIRVAAPMEQPEIELEDDFLEKTDSFIGRMKWSVFRENK